MWRLKLAGTKCCGEVVRVVVVRRTKVDRGASRKKKMKGREDVRALAGMLGHYVVVR